VDPAPFKLWLLPWLRRVPRGLATAATALVSAASLPVDALLAQRLPERSWHALFVLEHAAAPAPERQVARALPVAPQLAPRAGRAVLLP
jgi:hypothetical protein